MWLRPTGDSSHERNTREERDGAFALENGKTQPTAAVDGIRSLGQAPMRVDVGDDMSAMRSICRMKSHLS